MKQFLKPSTQLSPIPAVIITACDKEGNSNMMTAAWVGIVNSNPPMCYVSIRPDRYTYHMVKETGQFAINMTTTAMARVTDLVGVISGKREDKWEKSGLTPESAKLISCPLIAESPLALECEVTEILPLGSHDMFLARIVSVAVDESIIDPQTGKWDIAKSNPLVYSHGEYFSQGDFLGYFGYSVRKDQSSIERRK